MIPERAGRRCYFFALLLVLLLLPSVLPAAGEEPVPGQDGSRGSVMGECNPWEGGTEEPALSVNEPMYFVIGRNDGDTRARFQFSFKYRIFDADSALVRNASWVQKLHLAYTQTSMWNLSGDSQPFEDSTYRPSFFWEFQNPQIGKMPDLFRLGYEHESNGQSGDNSRSFDTLFILPAWETHMGGRSLIVGPKLYAYVAQGEQNRDIEAYRGYADLIIRYGNEDSWLMAALWRHGTDNRNTIQLDFSYPIRRKFFARTGGFFYVQSFYGYGESLLAYNQRQDLNVRFGFAIVR